MTTPIENRYDFVMLFDVQDGNPNGDPDAGNLPRIDPQTGQGLVTDVCLKRKVRNYVLADKALAPGFDIFVKEKAVLNELIEQGYKEAGIDLDGKASETEEKGKAKAKKPARDKAADVDRVRKLMCQKYFDIRTFGAVMSTGANAGQVRGPVQLTFGRSVDPIVALEHSITRMAVATREEAEKQGGDNRTMGRKNTVPYGLYVAHGFISPQFAKQTGFSAQDLELLWSAFRTMFEIDRSAARGLMSMRRVIAFKHDSPLGNAPAHKLFDLVKVKRKPDVAVPRAFSDYEVSVAAPPEGVSLIEIV
jgi:CRISPR-associated protein Csd2